MSEEEKQEKHEESTQDQAEKASEKKPEEKPKKEEKPEEKEEAKPKAPHGKERKKISRMTLDELEKELKTVQEKMGGFRSDFARHLLARKKELTKSPS